MHYKHLMHGKKTQNKKEDAKKPTTTFPVQTSMGLNAKWRTWEDR